MHHIFWKTLTALLLLCLLAQHLGRQDWSLRSQKKRLATLQRPISDFHPHNTSVALSVWNYDWQRDHDNHSLSDAQCDTAFPQLYEDIDRAVQHGQSRNITTHTIGLWNRNEGGVKILFRNQQLRIVETRGMYRNDFSERILAVCHSLLRATASAAVEDMLIDDFEATIVVDDWPVLSQEQDGKELALWSFARDSSNRDHDRAWLIPDFNFWKTSGEDFTHMQAKARTYDSPIAEKEQKIIWRGVDWTNPLVRGALVNVTRDRPWADVKTIDWNDHVDMLTPQEFCHYAYVVNTEGRSWSSRLTHLLNCDAVPISHELKWVAHYYHLLEPDVNFVSVDRDFSDLSEKMEFYLAHPSAAQDIADKARVTFRERYTTPAATTCYWRRLLRSWSSMTFKPEGIEAADRDQTQGEQRKRGIAIEEFLCVSQRKCCT